MDAAHALSTILYPRLPAIVGDIGGNARPHAVSDASVASVRAGWSCCCCSFVRPAGPAGSRSSDVTPRGSVGPPTLGCRSSPALASYGVAWGVLNGVPTVSGQVLLGPHHLAGAGRRRSPTRQPAAAMIRSPFPPTATPAGRSTGSFARRGRELRCAIDRRRRWPTSVEPTCACKTALVTISDTSRTAFLDELMRAAEADDPPPKRRPCQPRSFHRPWQQDINSDRQAPSLASASALPVFVSGRFPSGGFPAMLPASS